jgi:2-dehydropantoate 2-reductase
MAAGRQPRIAVAGAGSIGCYVGGCLASAGRDVTLLLRPALADAIGRYGLRLSDLEGFDRSLPPPSLRLATDPAAALADAELVLVTVKSGATAGIADLIARHAKLRPVVLSLQNGVGNTDVLRERLGAGWVVLPGVVNFHVAQMSDAHPPRFHRSTGGSILIGREDAGLADTLRVTGVHVTTRADMPAVLWGKLLLNLNNAINALSGLPLVTQLGDREWRRVLAAQVQEALAVLAAARIEPARLDKVPPKLIPMILQLPDPVFRLLARRMLAIDPEARSSMWDDLQRRRPTEVDYLQGAIIALGEKTGTPTPVAHHITKLIKAAEAAGRGSPGLGPGEVRGAARSARAA